MIKSKCVWQANNTKLLIKRFLIKLKSINSKWDWINTFWHTKDKLLKLQLILEKLMVHKKYFIGENMHTCKAGWEIYTIKRVDKAQCSMETMYYWQYKTSKSCKQVSYIQLDFYLELPKNII